MDADTKGSGSTALELVRTEDSEDSEGSFSIPSPQLVERSGNSSPLGFFYEVESTCPPPAFPQKIRSWTRGLDTSSLKRYLRPVATRKPTDSKLSESGQRSTHLIRQRAYSPLLTLERPMHAGGKVVVRQAVTGRGILRLSKRTGKDVKKGGNAVVGTPQCPSQQKSLLHRSSPFRLKPLRSLTPQLTRLSKPK